MRTICGHSNSMCGLLAQLIMPLEQPLNRLQQPLTQELSESVAFSSSRFTSRGNMQLEWVERASFGCVKQKSIRCKPFSSALSLMEDLQKFEMPCLSGFRNLIEDSLHKGMKDLILVGLLPGTLRAKGV